MRIFSFIAAALLLSTLSWGAETAVTSSGAQTLAQSGLGETTKDSGCPCRNQAAVKRLDGDLGVEDGDDTGDGARTVR